MSKNSKHLSNIFFLLIFVFLIKNANSADVNITADTNSQQTLQASSTLTIKSGFALRNVALDRIVKGYNPEIDDATVVIEENATIEGKANVIYVRETSGFTLTNSGSLIGNGSKAINLRDTQNPTITNNKGATISGTSNTIVQQSTATEDATGLTITNHGTIKAEGSSSERAIYIYQPDGGETAVDATITNSSTGNIYNTRNSPTIAIDTSSTLTNSGTIENRNSPSSKSIHVVGNNNTVILKDGGKVIGLIDSDGTGNELKIKHGAGQSYYYETEGTFDLEDLDGNVIVEGSAGSVGQGGNEILDEQLGHKSINLRKSITKFKRSEQYLNQDDTWSEIFSSFERRQGKRKTLRLEHNNLRAGANIIQPGQNSNQLFSIETGRQEFSKDHNIDRISISGGFISDEKQTKLNSKIETFFVWGVTLNKSDRRILTNTTTTGFLDIDDQYFSYDALYGGKFLNNMIPDFSYSLGYGLTPNHEESEYYKWQKKEFLNASVALSDEYLILNDDKSKLYFSWLTDYREVIAENVQEFKVNNVLAEYDPHEDLSREITVTAGIDYEFQPQENSLFSINLDGLYSSQQTYGAQAKLYYKSLF